MRLMNRLDKKFGRYGIQNLTMYMVICYVLGYFLMYLKPELLTVMSLEPALILKGQIWRLFTWVIYPPSSGNFLLFAVSILFFYYPIGTSLERIWGSFRYTLYIFSGLLFTVLGAFLLYFITGAYLSIGRVSIFTTYYISMSVFLAYAMSYPEQQLLLWFVIPIKMRWMAYVYTAIILYEGYSYIRYGMWFMTIPIAASLLNFVIFFLGTRNVRRYSPKEIHRKQEFKKAVAKSRVNSQTGEVASKHKCAICGRTEKDHPDLEFRFCSKCNGNYEYCQDHLFTHEHVK